MFLYVVLFTLLCVAAAFGPTYLLLRRTPYAPHSVLLSLVSFQPLLLVCVTLLGYRMPLPLKPAHVFVPVLAGICLTGFVTLRYRGEIAATLRETWKPSLLIYGLAMASMALATPILVGSRSLAYIDWMNGELVNYSHFAHVFLGMLRDPNYFIAFKATTSLRYGAELFLAALSTLTRKAPLLVVEVLTAFHKASAIVAFGVSCELARKERGLLPVAVMAADVGFAFSTILSLNHALAFLGAQAVTASFILLGLGLLGDGIRTRRVQAFLAVHVLFIVITYPEALPFLCGVGGLVVIEAVCLRRQGVPSAVLGTVGAGLFVNPLLLVQRLGYLYLFRVIVGGFNVLGNPRDDLEAYLAAALGFHYQFLDVAPLPRVLLASAIVLGLAAITCAFVVAASRLRTVLFLVIPLVLVLVHLDITASVQPIWAAYYKSYKTIAALYFYMFFAQAFLLDVVLRHRPRRGVAGAARWLLLAGVCGLIAGNVFVSIQAAATIKGFPSVYREADIRRALEPTGTRGGPVVILADDPYYPSFWDLMANSLGAPRLLLDRKQAGTVYHLQSVVLTEPTVVPDGAVKATPAQPEELYTGKIILPLVAGYSPGERPIDPRAVLEATAPGLRLVEDKTLFATTAFRVIEGTLISTHDPGAAVDGTRNQPPAIVRVEPALGSGSNAIFSFTYADPNGSSDVAAGLVLINSALTAARACYVTYTTLSNVLGLARDGGDAWDVTIMGSSKELENSQCAVDAADSSRTLTGHELTLRLALRFKPAFAGHKTVYTSVSDEGKLTTGWQPVAGWDVP
jgi:hypothetical protein